MIKTLLFFALALDVVKPMEQPDEAPAECHFRFASGEEACPAIDLESSLPTKLCDSFKEIGMGKQIWGELKLSLLDASAIKDHPLCHSDVSIKLVKGPDGVSVIIIDPESVSSFRIEKIMPGAIRVVMIGNSLPDGTRNALILDIYLDATKEDTIIYLDSIKNGDLGSIWDLKSRGLNPVIGVNSERGDDKDDRRIFILPTTIQVLEEVLENCVRIPIVYLINNSGWGLTNIPEIVKPALTTYYGYSRNLSDKIVITTNQLIKYRGWESKYFFLKVTGMNLRGFGGRYDFFGPLFPWELSGKCACINRTNIIGPGGVPYCFEVNPENLAKLSGIDEDIDLTRDDLYQILDGLDIPLKPLELRAP